MAKKLIITADDFGLVNHIDDAIIDLVADEVVSCVSCFGNIEVERLVTQFDKLFAVKNDIGIGIHLTITSHQSCKQIETGFTEQINGTHFFKKTKKLDFDALVTSKDALIEELQAQIDRLQVALGERKIDHISCHHNVFYLDKRLFDIYLEVAHKNKLHIRSPRRCTLLSNFKPIKDLEPLIPDIAIEGIRALPFRYYGQAIKANGKKQVNEKLNKMELLSIDSAHYFFINLYGNPEIEIVEMAYPLIQDEEICEQIMHLSIGNQNNEPVPNGINEKYFPGRRLEYELLKSASFKVILGQSGFTLGSFRTFL